ncbi:Holliday junction branch migration protein RuvA [Hugenholtzia roseola]|uniref:Holliday junction branch migration protein RuvA n=1 Tax=Hugenholtzia roseola TaxID=1002 RepID=UPI00041406CB|nr:Holliday junction branch migration protein RuvA [Hugenholtzia roseola]
MYAYLKGKLASKEAPYLVIETPAGIAFEVRATQNVVERFEVGAECQIFTYLRVREDAQELFGFSSEREKKLFLLLVGVSDVGAATALAVISAMPMGELVAAILNNDAKRLQAVKGVGAKTAQKIVLELKDKLPKEGFHAEMGENSIAAGRISDTVQSETLAALMALGMNKIAAERSIRAVLKSYPEESFDQVEKLLRLALQQR